MKNLKSADSIEELLSSRGLKITSFRLQLLSVLLCNPQPRSASQLMMEVPGRFDRVTLFRNLKSLEEKGLLKSADFGQGASYYSLVLQQNHQHHIFCVKCEKVEPLDVCMISPMIEKARRRGFKVLSHHLELTGLCPRCA